MNILHKILEEIEHEAMTNKEIGRKQCEGMARAMTIIRSHIDNSKGTDMTIKCSECSRRKWYQIGYEDGRKDMCEDGWIPVEEQLPEENKRVLVTVKHSGWIADFYSNWVPEEEKIKHPETSGTYIGYIHENSVWTFVDEEGQNNICDIEFGQNLGRIYDVVTHWRPLPEPYKSENTNDNTTKEYQQEVEHLLEKMKTENGYIRVSNLAKRFEKIDKELFKNSSWNLLQILSNINILIPKHFD